MIVASIDPVLMSRFFSAMEIGHGFVFLSGLDGIIRAGVPASREMLGHDVEAMPILRAAQASEQKTIEFRDRFGSPEIGSFRRLDRSGLLVAVAFSRKDVLAPFVRSASQYLIGGGLLSGLILLVASMLIRHKRRLLGARANLLQSRAVLAETLESMNQGIMLIDAERRIPVINRRAIELLGLPRTLQTRDLSLDQILHWQSQQGSGSGGSGGDGARPVR